MMEKVNDKRFFKFIGYDFNARQKLNEIFGNDIPDGAALIKALVDKFCIADNIKEILPKYSMKYPDVCELFQNDLYTDLFLLAGSYCSEFELIYRDHTWLPFDRKIENNNERETYWCRNLKCLFPSKSWNQHFLKGISDKTRINQYSFYNIDEFMGKLDSFQEEQYLEYNKLLKKLHLQLKNPKKSLSPEELQKHEFLKKCLRYSSNTGIENKLVLDKLLGSSLAEICCFYLKGSNDYWNTFTQNIVYSLCALKCTFIRNDFTECILKEIVLQYHNNENNKNIETYLTKLNNSLKSLISSLNALYGFLLYNAYESLLKNNTKNDILTHIVQQNAYNATLPNHLHCRSVIKKRIDQEKEIIPISPAAEMTPMDKFNFLEHLSSYSFLMGADDTTIKEILLSQNEEKKKSSEQRANSRITKTATEQYTQIQYFITYALWEISH